MKFTFKHIISLSFAFLPVSMVAEAPSGYYRGCENLSGEALLKALYNTVAQHTNVGYDGLWKVYETSDVYPDDGKVWDMYSTKHWTVNQNQCGNYKNVGDCYNREHSFPKSWFDKASPMVSDGFHIYPTDGKVNGQRSNFPYGECANGTTLPSSNGIRALGRLGASTFPGYSGTVFEPDNQYKGDFARSYFYMAAAYYNRISSWDSPMLNGTAYPAFSPWAVELLLKWHRNDPVSAKEITRNDAVYAYQHNRNPFIDHPELVEYIWGNKKNQKWQSAEVVAPKVIVPVDGTTLDMGYAVINRTKTSGFDLKCEGLKADVALSVSGTGFSVSPSVIKQSDANNVAGTTFKISVLRNVKGPAYGVLTISSGSLSVNVDIEAFVTDGLPVYPAANISDRSFTARWVNIGDADASGCYSLYLQEEGGETQCLKVKADIEEADVDGLSPATRYSYWITSQSLSSEKETFVTADPIPSVQLLYDGDLAIETTEGQPSQAYEILVDAENIFSDIEISVTAPFQLSTDKSEWAQSVSLSPEEERFYIRLFADREGQYETEVTVTSGQFSSDATVIVGRVFGDSPFHEDFEADADGCDTYNGCEFKSPTCTWYLKDAGIWASDNSSANGGKQAVRMGKSANSVLEMRKDKLNGIGRVTVYASKWTDNEGPASFVLEYSTNQGADWLEGSGVVQVNSLDFTQFEFDVNVPGDARIRIRQTAGKRFMVDDITITNYTLGSLEGVDSDYHSWDAFCRGGRLVITSRCSQKARVYGVDGIVYLDSPVTAGETAISLPRGLYVVAVEGFTRTVLVR